MLTARLSGVAGGSYESLRVPVSSATLPSPDGKSQKNFLPASMEAGPPTVTLLELNAQW